MASRTLPGLGLKGFWGLGEDGWKDEMDADLRLLSALVQPRVLSIVAATPGAPADGNIHYFSAAHPTNPNSIAIRDNGAWVYVAAFEGMTFYNVADDQQYRYDGATLVRVGLLIIDAVAGAAYTFATGDHMHHKRFGNAGATTATVPKNATDPIPIGTRIRGTAIAAHPAGQVTIAPEDGTVTLNSRGGALKSMGQFSVFEIEKVALNEWDVLGDLTA